MRERHPAQYIVENHCLRVEPLEDLDQHNVDRIRVRMDKLIEECGIDEIIFDFRKVEFMDSSGIGMIMGRYRRISFRNGKLRAVGINEAVGKILRYSGLYQILDVTTGKEV